MRRFLPAAAFVVLAGCGSTAPVAVEAPPPQRAFVAQPAPRVAAKPMWRYTTARVLRRTALRTAPGGHVVARIGRATEFGSPRVLAVTGRRGGWLRVIASERRNRQRAWVRAGAVQRGGTDISIHVD